MIVLLKQKQLRRGGRGDTGREEQEAGYEKESTNLEVKGQQMTSAHI
jgi:hypothetical protein